MAGQFRYSVWDPVLIVSQIITMQCVFYLSLGAWLFILDSMVGLPVSLGQIFRYQDLEIKESGGKLIVAAYVLNSCICAMGLWTVVQRTKQCLDFTITIHLVHLIICWFYNGSFPTAITWWLLMVVCMTLLCVFGEFLCMRTEMKAIPVNMGQKTDL